MKDYGYGKLMDDYVFLEDGKRKAEQWGKEIIDLKMGSSDCVGEGQNDITRKAAISGKTLALQQALRERGVYVDFLPEGMERRRRNQSHYNPKYVPRIFHPVDFVLTLSKLAGWHHVMQEQTSPDLYGVPIPFTSAGASHVHSTSTPSSVPSVPSYQMQNIPLNDSTSLQRIYSVQARKMPPHYPTKENHESRNITEDLIFAMKVYHPSGVPLSAPSNIGHTPLHSQPSSESYYSPLSATASLESAIKGTAFVEFPTIEVYLRLHWEQLIETRRITVQPPIQVAEHVQNDKTSRMQTRQPPGESIEHGTKRKTPDAATGEEETADIALYDASAKKLRTEQDAAGAEQDVAPKSPPPDHKEARSPSATPQQTPQTTSLAPEAEGAIHADTKTLSGLLSLDYGSESEDEEI
ncbi:hypothetical protein QFC19_005014 [Naganishia cerealis]|uniref:Uncharacterized protein n=1 Tax=Naganishia cerealis TaxID=610337 RepID=A0ACC2VRA0_9TREE|nr:hypothetical protein QFC19_005014 [Naganishia cerealis]